MMIRLYKINTIFFPVVYHLLLLDRLRKLFYIECYTICIIFKNSDALNLKYMKIKAKLEICHNFFGIFINRISLLKRV